MMPDVVRRGSSQTVLVVLAPSMAGTNRRGDVQSRIVFHYTRVICDDSSSLENEQW